MNKKVTRLLDALAIVLAFERPCIIQEVHNVINDKRDGYPYDFKGQVANTRTWLETVDPDCVPVQSGIEGTYADIEGTYEQNNIFL